MNGKKIVIAGIAGGVLLTVLGLLFGMVASAIAPFDIFAIGGMRSAEDPLMVLFFVYPFVVALAAAILFDVVKDALPGDMAGSGLLFGLLLFLVITVPNLFLLYATMTYPAGFYIQSALTGVIGYPLMGIIDAYIWGMVS